MRSSIRMHTEHLDGLTNANIGRSALSLCPRAFDYAVHPAGNNFSLLFTKLLPNKSLTQGESNQPLQEGAPETLIFYADPIVVGLALQAAALMKGLQYTWH